LATWRAAVAVLDPAPHLVQRAVRQCILSLLVLDAAAAFPAAGTFGSAAILGLLLPMLLLRQWFDST
jgi:hypothetical protein